MSDHADPLGGLAPDERARLQRFATVFERLDASQYVLLADAFPSEDVLEAQARAVDRVGGGRRRDAVRAAIRVFTDEAGITYSRRIALPDTFLLYQSLADKAVDRMRFLGSVERAVVALIL